MSAPAPAPEPAPVELTEYFCHECESSVSLPVTAAPPFALRPSCPLCRGDFLEPSPFHELDPPPPPPRVLLPGIEENDGPLDLEEPDELDDIEFESAAEARLYITRFIEDRLHAVAAPEDIAAATAAAMSLLDGHIPRAELPAPLLSILALPTVEVSDPDADCAICLQDLPLASSALKLPCSHLYHAYCIVPWLQRHNSCPLCRSRLPLADPMEALPSDLRTTITIRLSTNPRHPVRVEDGAAEAPVSSSPTQLAQAGTGEGGGGPANSGDTVSSEWPPQPDTDTVMSEARDGDGFFD